MVKSREEDMGVGIWEGIMMGQTGGQPGWGMVEHKSEKDFESHIQEFGIKFDGSGESQKVFGYMER